MGTRSHLFLVNDGSCGTVSADAESSEGEGGEIGGIHVADKSGAETEGSVGVDDAKLGKGAKPNNRPKKRRLYAEKNQLLEFNANGSGIFTDRNKIFFINKKLKLCPVA
jgi:hypothetical protein